MKRKIAFDMVLNIVATAIPTFVLQLLILPMLAKYMDSDEYGILVTVLAVLNVVPATLGNSMNNIRLIAGGNISAGKAKNYNALLLIMAVLNVIVVGSLVSFYDQQISLTNLSLTLIVALLWMYRDYHLVAFRLNINYPYIMFSNLLLIPGYLVGWLLFQIDGRWQWIYIFGNLSALVFILTKSRLWCEPIETDVAFTRICGQTALLFTSNMLNRITTYADKMLILPILGGTTVSIYYVATLFGKVVSLVITPVSSVMLSYLARLKKKNDSVFWQAVLSSAVVCTIGYFVCLIISRPVLGWIYPQYVDDAMHYIAITTGTMVLTALITIVNPFVLKFYDMKWQVLINSFYVFVYIGLTLLLLTRLGLYGFCLGSLVAASVKLLFLMYTYARRSVK